MWREFRRMKILPLFASNTFILENIEENIEISEHLHRYIGPEEPGSAPSLPKDIQVLNTYPDLKNRLLEEFKKIAVDILSLHNDFMITTSWLTRTFPGQARQDFHAHKNSYYSGVFYYGDYYPESGGIEFVSPLVSYSDFFIIPDKLSIINSPTWHIYPEKNTLILFPSYVEHRITENTSTEIRFSLSFNIIPKGLYGYADSTFNTDWINESIN